MEKQPHKSALVCFHACVLVSIHYTVYTDCTDLASDSGWLKQCVMLIFISFSFHLLLVSSSLQHIAILYPVPHLHLQVFPQHTHIHAHRHTLSSPQKPSQVKLHRFKSRQRVPVCLMSQILRQLAHLPLVCLCLIFFLFAS